MEDLSTALFYDTVPDTWVARAYPSMMGLAAWYADLLQRIRVSHRTLEPPAVCGPGPQSPYRPPLLRLVGRPGPAPQMSDQAGVTFQGEREQRSERIKPRGVPRVSSLSMRQRQEHEQFLCQALGMLQAQLPLSGSYLLLGA